MEGRRAGEVKRCSRCGDDLKPIADTPPVEYRPGELAEWVRCSGCGHIRLALMDQRGKAMRWPATDASVSTRRIKVLAEVRLRTPEEERTVTLVALSSRGALVLSQRSIGVAGECVDLELPAVGGKHVTIAAGIDEVDQVTEGMVSKVEFMIVEAPVRKTLDDLLLLLLAVAGDGGGSRRGPRVKYGVPVLYGELGQHRAKLIEISVNGLAMRSPVRLACGAPLRVELPDPLVLEGTVVNVRPSESVAGTFEVGMAFGPLPQSTLLALRRLLSDLVRGQR